MSDSYTDQRDRQRHRETRTHIDRQPDRHRDTQTDIITYTNQYQIY